MDTQRADLKLSTFTRTVRVSFLVSLLFIFVLVFWYSKVQRKISTVHLEPNRMVFVTGLTKMRTTSDTKISRQKKLRSKVKRAKQRRRKKLTFSEVKQNLYSIVTFVDSNQQYDKYYVILREMRQDVVKKSTKEEHKRKLVHF